MELSDFQQCIDKNRAVVENIRSAAHQLHAHVNQTYDKVHPYGFHLDMVADSVYKYGHHVCACEEDVVPLLFGAYYHDSIEDARLTYNDVTRQALQYMNERQAYMAAEIVYALTNDKGRNRAERAGENYYRGIRQTPYAPFIKLADRLANITYSCRNTNAANSHMREVYKGELPHFLTAIGANKTPEETPAPADMRFALPADMIERIYRLFCTTGSFDADGFADFTLP